ncbi:hypothetical protein [Butyrivibrio proteoclasticus]|uniref:hypothetical protein n=1 Tax=Butyrivibrio proteoclasticus TaxID=43305 RepID=UPI0005A8EA8C|nr:hypothetical protein [Butyrivibrio proteoclasticus]
MAMFITSFTIVTKVAIVLTRSRFFGEELGFFFLVFWLRRRVLFLYLLLCSYHELKSKDLIQSFLLFMIFPTIGISFGKPKTRTVSQQLIQLFP